MEKRDHDSPFVAMQLAPAHPAHEGRQRSPRLQTQKVQIERLVGVTAEQQDDPGLDYVKFPLQEFPFKRGVDENTAA